MISRRISKNKWPLQVSYVALHSTKSDHFGPADFNPGLVRLSYIRFCRVRLEQVRVGCVLRLIEYYNSFLVNYVHISFKNKFQSLFPYLSMIRH